MKNRTGKTGVPKSLKKYHKSRIVGRNQRLILARNVKAESAGKEQDSTDGQCKP